MLTIAQAQAVRAEESPYRADVIVVTAERTDRSLDDTAASVQVATQDDIETLAGTYSTGDVLARIPNVVVTDNGGIGPAVRGIDGTGPVPPRGRDAS